MKFNFFGTEIYVSFLFCAVVCFMLAVDRTGLVIPTLFAVFIHETGHLLAMWAADCQPKQIRLIPSSVQIVRSFSPKRCGETAIAFCGPAANLVIFGVLTANYFIFKSEQSITFALLNLVIAVFNLLPVSGLDGGTLLTLFVAHFTDIYRAERIVRIITAVFAFVAFLLGVYLWVSGTVNISVFIVAVYLGVCSLIKK
ncbi:MAG: site-2 protease family protein [Clostridia bacterium]|nr:site-2 protease family protein [Clostridia bacterium]